MAGRNGRSAFVDGDEIEDNIYVRVEFRNIVLWKLYVMNSKLSQKVPSCPSLSE